ncbi:lysostaphin resistance A-like protein [Rhodoferax sp.]|jgi:membrane protease YdiL (CAAX protease family)|uniref:lysostaphin resistance A-like protein n=1 Tax=Rhodoferax sp. TaxID=50421 RepID=UPI003784C5B1
MQQKEDAFPNIQQSALLLLAGFLLQYVIAIALYDYRRSIGLGEHELAALSMLLGNGLVLATVLHFQRRSYRDLLHSSATSALATTTLLVPPVLLLVPLITLLDYALVSFLQNVFPLSRWEEQAFANMVAGSVGSVVAACILAPVLEEMLFRGVLLRSFLQQQPRWQAISVSALFFGFAHLNIYQFVLAFWLGLVLGWLYERSRSLIPCIALHGALNSWVVVSAQGVQAQNSTSTEFSAVGWAASLLAALIGVWLLRRFLIGSSAATPKNVA